MSRSGPSTSQDDGGKPHGSVQPSPIEDRPAPWAPPPEGYHFEAYEAEGWVVPPIGAGRCHAGATRGRRACGKPAVASCMRLRWRSHGPSNPVPWDYCAEHLYGGWIEGGKVLRWRLVRDGEGE